MATDAESSPVERLTVPLAHDAYPILIGSGWWHQVGETIGRSLPDMTHAVLVCDAAVSQRWGQPLVDQLRQQGVRTELIEVPSGEPSKSVAQLQQLWQAMLTARTDRRSVLLALGGGVVGDLAGFAAATYARGIRMVQIPTTLLSQVDSSVGGKTGINLPTAKNMVGAFWQPSLVVIDTHTLGTLPDRTYLSGLAEVVKYGVIADASFFAWLEQNAAALTGRQGGALRHAVACSCQCKADVVADDEREISGRRATLNYGHTFAHAIEATAGYGRFLHGEAVAVGMQMAARLAGLLGLAEAEIFLRQRQLLERMRLPVEWAEADPDAMLPIMHMDKKVAHGRLRFILPTRIGRVEMVDEVPETLVRQAIDDCRNNRSSQT